LLLSARGVVKYFEVAGRRIDVLREVDFDVYAGDTVAIVGRSGSGKSTLLHVLGTLDEPSAGMVSYHGRSLTPLGETELAAFRNRTIGFVFQFHHLLPELTAFENVLMPCLIARKPRAEARDTAESWLRRVGLQDRMEHHPGELSGGEQQRVALARALVMSPELVLADEPTGNLDGRTAAEVHDLMEQLNEETGVTFVIVSHNSDLSGRTKRLLRMVEGCVQEIEVDA
jgi:lipoprotein-releasing system ATP-binding protein